jgi:hypothetical protein
MAGDSELDRLMEIHEDLRVRTKVWLRNEDWGEEESRGLREEAALLQHRRYMRQIPSYRVLAEWSGVGEDLQDVGVIKTEFMSTDDIFKSYDPKLIDKGDWQGMTSWLRKVFHSEIPGDFTQVGSMEEWIRKLEEQEVHVVCSSGTSGDYSFVPRDPLTRQAGMINVFGTYESMFSDMNVSEYHAAILSFRSTAIGIQSAGVEVAKVAHSSTFLYDWEMPTDVVRILQKGPADEEEQRRIEAFQRMLAEQKEERYKVMLASLRECGREGRKALIFGTPYQIKELCEMATVHGSADLPEGSILISGGGWKSFENERIDKAELLRRTEASVGLGAGSMMEGYTMTELNVMMICCGHERFHVPPLLEPMVFDEALMPLTGKGVTGVFGFLDPFAFSYPGFLITGDQVKLVYGDCPCGRKGYALKGEIRRAPGKEVKGCGGIMASVKA